MKKSLFVLSAVLMAMLSGCSLVVPKDQYTALQTENTDLTAQIEQLQGHVAELEEQIASLDQSITNRQERETTDPFDEKILSSLFLRPDLIPVGGEKMRYYTEICRVLGERYVYAYAEDGRNAADMILSYERQPDDTYLWTLEVYDDGGGWQTAASPDDDAAGASSAPAPSEPVEAPQAPPEPSEPPAEPSETPQAPDTSVSSSAAQAPENASSTPSVNVPVPNEAQQQKFREIASLVD